MTANITDPFLNGSNPAAAGKSPWGSVIPISWGRRQVEGKVIWVGKLTTDGEGNSVGDFAVCFGKSIIPEAERAYTQVLRLWADGTIIYNTLDPAAPGFLDMPFTLHPGFAHQDPDSTILADKGDLTPSFKGLIYAVFTGFPLWRLGLTGKLPTIRAELVDVASITNSASEFSRLDDTAMADSRMIWADWKRDVLYTFNGIPAGTIEEYSISGQQELRRGTLSPTLRLDLFSVYDPVNRLLFGCSGLSNVEPIVAVSLETLSVIASFGTPRGLPILDDASGFVLTKKGAPLHWREAGVDYYGCAFGSFSNNVGVLQYTHSAYDVGGLVGVDTKGGTVTGTDLGFSFLGTFTVPTRSIPVIGGAIGQMIEYPVAGRQDLVDRFGTSENARQDTFLIYGNYEDVGLAQVSNLGVGTPEAFFTFGAGIQPYDFMIDPADYSIIAFCQDTTYGTIYIAKLLVDVKLLPDGSGLKPFVKSVAYFKQIDAQSVFGPSLYNSRITNGLLAVPKGSAHKFSLINLATGVAVIDSADATNFWPVGTPFVWDSSNYTVYLPRAGGGVGGIDGTIAYRINVDTLGEVRLDDSLRWLAIEAGFDPSEVFVSGISDIIWGGLITQTTDLGAVAKDMAAVFDFQFFESDGKLKFVRAPKDSGATVVYELGPRDLLQAEGGGQTVGGDSESIVTEIAAPDEVPSDVQITYVDLDMDYSTNSQTFHRPRFPVATTQSHTPRQFIVPIIMQGADVIQRAARLAYQLHSESVAQHFRLPFKFARLEPSDVVSVTVGAFQYILKLVELVLNADWSISTMALNHEYKSDVTLVGNSPLGRVEQQTTGPSDSIPFVLDIPLLTASGDPPGAQTSFYTAAASYGQPWWTFADVYSKLGTDAKTFDGRQLHTLGIGIAEAALPAVVNPWRTHDEFDLNVVARTFAIDDGSTPMPAPSFSTVLPAIASLGDDERFRAGENAMLIGAPGRWELVYFRDVTMLSSKRAKLSTLLRGRRGTELHTDDHGVGDTVILLASQGAKAPLFAPLTDGTNRGKSLVVTAVGDRTSGTPPVAATTFRDGGTAIPWSVQQIAGVASGSDVVITWERRTRLASELHDGDADTPLGEVSEVYDLEIYSGPGGTLKRTVNGLVAKTYTYLAADQATDGFTAPAPQLTLRIYQVSARVGRGLVKETTIVR